MWIWLDMTDTSYVRLPSCTCIDMAFAWDTPAIRLGYACIWHTLEALSLATFQSSCSTSISISLSVLSSERSDERFAKIRQQIWLQSTFYTNTFFYTFFYTYQIIFVLMKKVLWSNDISVSCIAISLAICMCKSISRIVIAQ